MRVRYCTDYRVQEDARGPAVTSVSPANSRETQKADFAAVSNLTSTYMPCVGRKLGVGPTERQECSVVTCLMLRWGPKRMTNPDFVSQEMHAEQLSFMESPVPTAENAGTPMGDGQVKCQPS